MTLAPVLIVGGSGVVGSRAVRTLRKLQPALPIAIGARDLSRANALAAQIGLASGVGVDLERRDLGLSGQAFSAVAVLLKDDTLASLHYALERGLPYIAFSDFSFEIAPTIAAYAGQPPRSPLLLLGQLLGGTVALASLYFARELRAIDSISISAVLDEDDSGGPAAQGDVQRVLSTVPHPLIRSEGRFVFARESEAQRTFETADGQRWEGQAFPLLDVASLAAASGARSLRVDFALRPRSAGEGRRTEVTVEIAGQGSAGRPELVRFRMLDRDVHAGMSAHGVAFALERLLGLAGGPAVAPGLYDPEVLLDPVYVVSRLRELGSEVERI